MQQFYESVRVCGKVYKVNFYNWDLYDYFDKLQFTKKVLMNSRRTLFLKNIQGTKRQVRGVVKRRERKGYAGGRLHLYGNRR